MLQEFVTFKDIGEEVAELMETIRDNIQEDFRSISDNLVLLFVVFMNNFIVKSVLTFARMVTETDKSDSSV